VLVEKIVGLYRLSVMQNAGEAEVGRTLQTSFELLKNKIMKIAILVKFEKRASLCDALI